MKKHIRVKAGSVDDLDFGIELSVDGKVIVKHLEMDLIVGLRRLLCLMGVKEDNFEIIDER